MRITISGAARAVAWWLAPPARLARAARETYPRELRLAAILFVASALVAWGLDRWLGDAAPGAEARPMPGIAGAAVQADAVCLVARLRAELGAAVETQSEAAWRAIRESGRASREGDAERAERLLASVDWNVLLTTVPRASEALARIWWRLLARTVGGTLLLVLLGCILGLYPGVMTLETCALPNLRYEVDRFLGPGEVVRITARGCETLSPPGDTLRICAFLWVYYGYPPSEYEGINVEEARNRSGAALARADDSRIDLVAGVPDSGTGHAIGYANESRIPYGRPFVKYTPTWPRSFMPQDQRVRDLVARMKLIPIRELIQGKRLLFCEDSIVRGTQLKDTIQRLYEYGAREVHMRPACPPLIHGCRFLNFSRSKSELDLAGRRAIEELGDEERHLDEYADPSSDRYAVMVDRIRTRLGLTTLRYQKLSDLVAAIGLPKEKLCTYCWDGEEGCRGCPGRG